MTEFEKIQQPKSERKLGKKGDEVRDFGGSAVILSRCDLEKSLVQQGFCMCACFLSKCLLLCHMILCPSTEYSVLVIDY